MTDNIVELMFSATDSDGDSVELYRVRWPDGRVTYTLDTRTDDGWALVGLTEPQALKLADVIVTGQPCPTDDAGANATWEECEAGHFEYPDQHASEFPDCPHRFD